MKKAVVSILTLVFLFACTANAQVPDKEGSLVKWISLKEALEKNETNPKPIILDFYTDWCGWCKHMMKTTYADPGLAAYINNFFYAAKFDAEGKDTIEYLGQKYLPTSTSPRTPHSLAVKLLQGRLSYPSTIFLNGYNKEKKEFSMNMLAAGYIETRKFEPMLIFSLENAFRNSNYDDFRQNYEKAFLDSAFNENIPVIPFIEPRDYFSKDAKPSGKKAVVFINTEWCNGCKVMKKTSFTDAKVKPFLTERFDIIDFNPESMDTLTYLGQTMVNPKSQSMAFHELAFRLTNGSFSFPTMVILDENRKVLDAVNSYLPPALLNDILHYFGEDINKVKTWQDYMSSKSKTN